MSKISAREMLRESFKQGLIKTARMPYENGTTNSPRKDKDLKFSRRYCSR